MTTISTIVADLKNSTPEVKDANRTIFRMFCPSSRYKVDFAEDFFSDKWEQFDTDQDAAYFGVWVNKDILLVLTYCEGDWIIVVCNNSNAYNMEIKEMCDFYGKAPAFTTVDDANITDYYQDRKEFFI